MSNASERRTRGISLVYGLKTDDEGYLASFYPARRLVEAGERLGIPCAPVLAGRLLAGYEARSGALRDTVVLLRGTVPSELRFRLHYDGFELVNQLPASELADDKLRSYLLFDELGVRYPHVLSAGRPRDFDLDCLARRLPLVVKPRYGLRGRGVRLVETKAELDALADEGDEDLIAQEYVSSSRGRDLRLPFVGTRFLPAVERVSGGFLANWSQGAVMKPAELPPGWLPVAERVRAAAGLFYGTVDFLFDHDGEPIACETNAAPGFEGYEGATGFDFASALVEAIAARYADTPS